MKLFSEKDVHSALKAVSKPNLDQSPLHNLYHFQLERKAGASEQQATQTLIKQALKQLRQTQADLASLLQARFLDRKSVTTVAHEVNVAEPTVLNWQRQGIKLLTAIIDAQEMEARRTAQAKLERHLNLPCSDLIGVEAALQTLLNQVLSPEPPWIISIEGLGGIGKTALAGTLIRELVLTAYFKAFAWTSAKQDEFALVFGAKKTDQPALDQITLVNSLLEQLRVGAMPNASPQEKMLALTELLKANAYFIVIDNLETATDYQSLLPILRTLVNPSRVLLTSRYSLRAYTDVACFEVQGLNRADTYTFIRQEAQQRQMMSLAQASKIQLDEIYQVVGGNPLALKLVIGQINFLPLAQVLTGLKATQNKASEALYTYIYWQAWHLLSLESQKLLLRMPLLHQGSLDQMAALNDLDPSALPDVLQPLIQLSLVQTVGDLEARRYTIHRLTETFLLNEAIQWQSLI